MDLSKYIDILQLVGRVTFVRSHWARRWGRSERFDGSVACIINIDSVSEDYYGVHMSSDHQATIELSTCSRLIELLIYIP